MVGSRDVVIGWMYRGIVLASRNVLVRMSVQVTAIVMMN